LPEPNPDFAFTQVFSSGNEARAEPARHDSVIEAVPAYGR
jgi:hypothetical protein